MNIISTSYAIGVGCQDGFRFNCLNSILYNSDVSAGSKEGLMKFSVINLWVIRSMVASNSKRLFGARCNVDVGYRMRQLSVHRLADR